MFKRLLCQINLAILLLFCLLAQQPVYAVGFGPLPSSLKGVPLPAVPGLLEGADPIITDKETAIAMGKALFWDTSIGSDGLACASCHFHAGADARSKNQLAPGGTQSSLANAQSFQPTNSGKGGPNYQLKTQDFPFFQLQNPLDPASTILFQSDDITGSSGTFSGSFKSVLPKDFSASGPTDENDICSRVADLQFHVGASGTRKATPRNAPTVINSIFNYRNFWDGRANNIFNGSSPWGDRDPNAGVWVKTGKTTVQKQRLALINSAIASLAVAPPLNTTEMSCNGRNFMNLAHKVLNRYALENQVVHYDDSVLGLYSISAGFNDPAYLQKGLYYTYHDFITLAFNRKYWSSPVLSGYGQASTAAVYTQMEANFSMFFGLSIQMYLSTLVSDDSPFDKSARDAQGLPTDLSAAALNGLDQFRTANCALCHVGPTFSAASITSNAIWAKSHPQAFGSPELKVNTTTNVVNRTNSLAGTTLMDTGFATTGVSADGSDIGLGGVDDFGKPLSFSLQYLQALAGNSAGVYDSVVNSVRPCDFQMALALNIPLNIQASFTQKQGVIPQTLSTADCITPAFAFQPTVAAVVAELSKPSSRKTLAVVNGLFKIPSLRNIELTGPYMHNGSMLTLEQVMEFYARGGNFDVPGKNFGMVFEQANLASYPQNRADIITFLKTLTDERVRYEKAPFDHPQIKIPQGHSDNENTITATHVLSPKLAADDYLVIDAVGASGITRPLTGFEKTLPR